MIRTIVLRMFTWSFMFQNIHLFLLCKFAICMFFITICNWALNLYHWSISISFYSDNKKILNYIHQLKPEIFFFLTTHLLTKNNKLHTPIKHGTCSIVTIKNVIFLGTDELMLTKYKTIYITNKTMNNITFFNIWKRIFFL